MITCAKILKYSNAGFSMRCTNPVTWTMKDGHRVYKKFCSEHYESVIGPAVESDPEPEPDTTRGKLEALLSSLQKEALTVREAYMLYQQPTMSGKLQVYGSVIDRIKKILTES